VRTLDRENASFDLKVVSKGALDEIDCIVVARFKIYVMHVIPPCSIDNSADARPKTSHRAHTARLERAVDCVALQRSGLQIFAQTPNDDHLRVGSRIMAHLSFIEADGCGATITDEHCNHAFAAGSPLTLSRGTDRQFHES
jgi:hypothetical protein